MSLDNYYDDFDYQSSENYLDIEYQIDLFEIRQCTKANKQKLPIPSYPNSRKTAKSQHPLIKLHGFNKKKIISL